MPPISLGLGLGLSHAQRPGPLVLDFRVPVAGFGVAVPAGCGYTRAACSSSVQYGTAGLLDLAGQAAIANLLVWGRADDAWTGGLVLEEERTNRVTSPTYWNAGGFTLGSPTRTTGQSDPASGTRAVRIQTPINGYVAEQFLTLGAGTFVTFSQWARNTVGGVDLLHEVGDSISYPTVALAAPATWVRYASPPTYQIDGGGICYALASDGRAHTGISAGARDTHVAFPQVEVGKYPTEYIPPTGAPTTRNATFLRALSATVTPKLATGRLSIELNFRPKGARTEYSGTHSLWYVDANNQAAFVASTGVLTITVAGATNTCTLPSWARYDIVELSVQCGGGLATVVKYRLNAGAVTTPAVTGSALGTHATGDLYLLSTNAGQHLSSWLYTAAFYAPGAPSWAA